MIIDIRIVVLYCLKHTVLHPFIYSLVNRQQRQVWSTKAEERQDRPDCQERWIEITL